MTRKILIAGAGIGGLTAASCLLEAGFDVEVYEQAPALGEVGAGIQVSANAARVLYKLGLKEEIEKLAVRPESYEFRLFDTGELLQTIPLGEQHEKAHGAPYYQLHRADIHNILARKAQSLKSNLIHLNSTVTRFTEMNDGVELHFANGATAKGDILIGADGIKSAIRKQIVGDTPAEYTGDIAWRLIVPAERLSEDIMRKVTAVWVGPGRHAVIYYLRSGKLLNFVGLVAHDEWVEESWTIKAPWQDVKRDFEGWHADIQSIIDAADRDQCYRWALNNRKPISNWSTARATLLGDSAHPTLPYLAQGAVMAIEDSAVLARCLLAEENPSKALDLYQRSRVDRTARIVNESTANQTLFHLPSSEALKEAFAKRNIAAERAQWLYSYDPLTVELG